MYVIGTAGHVDHGKSALVKALTGIDPDRLVEEKTREMTIDLGFAWMILDGNEIGIIDVPGHRDFIENMLAGVGGIDLALLVIAADEGVMPQTREHLAILDLLHVSKGVIALSKIDLIDDPDWLDFVSLEINDVIQGTNLAGSPVVPVSAHSGSGLERLRQAIAESLCEVNEKLDIGRPRLPIDRIFTLPGFGTVVTGTLLDGSLRVGTEVEIIPGGQAGRIRGLQTHKTKLEIAHPGNRVAINLSGVNRDLLHRGQVVTISGHARSTQLIDVEYRHLADLDAPLPHNAEVKLFSGAAEVTARTRIIGSDSIAPGHSGWLQLQLKEPIAVQNGDRFILRLPSPARTIGGGVILDAHPKRRVRRFRQDSAERFQALAKGDPEELLLRTLARIVHAQMHDLLGAAVLPEEEGRAHLSNMIESGQIIKIGKSYVAASTIGQLSEHILVTLRQYHEQEPMRAGLDREALRSRLNIPPPIFSYVINLLAASGQAAETGTLLRLSDHQVEFTAEQERAIERLIAQMDSLGTQSPSVKECRAAVGETIYSALVEQGRLHPISEDVVYNDSVYQLIISKLVAFLQDHGSLSLADTRDLLGTSRKYAIALLEHLDDLHLTMRAGDTRIPTRPVKK